MTDEEYIQNILDVCETDSKDIALMRVHYNVVP